jgi:penicillin amidase
LLRNLRRVAIVLVALVAVACGSTAFLVRRQLPDASIPRLASLSADVHVDLDARAVPTIRAATLDDALRAEGYLVARERMFQMELERRAADGTLAEIVGAAALPLDRIHRLYDFRRVAEAAVPLLPADERASLAAYAEGVNAFIESHRGRWGLEFQILHVEPRPWTPADSLKVLLLMDEDLSSSWMQELRREPIARTLTPEQARLLMPQVTDHDVLVVPDADPKPTFDVDAAFAPPHAMRDAAGGAGGTMTTNESLGLPRDAGERRAELGSNNWVVSGDRTRSGKPLLANDPHLALDCPGIWYALRLEIGPRWVEGVSIPGLPGITIGQNDRIAWGFTNLGTDVQDLYREPKVSERTESIAILGATAEAYVVAMGAHGPQVRPGYSLAWVALDPANVKFPLAALLLATDWESFNAAVDDLAGPAQNIVYADVDGHIGWRATGLIPIRKEGDDGALPRDGADPSNAWRGFVPASEMPRVLDPPQGYIVTANERVIGSSFPHVVTTDWASPNRARRITERIERASKIDRDEMESIQLDVVSPFHRELADALRAALPPDLAPKLDGWDGAARADDSRYTDARGWEVGLTRALHARLLRRALGDDAEDFNWSDDDATLLAILRADDAAWVRAGLGDKASFIAEAAAEMRKWRARGSPTWGERNTLRIHHLFGTGGGLAGFVFDPPGFPQNGGSITVRMAQPSAGQSMRMIADLGAPDETTIVLPLGQSGHLWSAHRTDQQATWRLGDPGGSETKMKQAAVDSLVLGP